MFAWYLMSLISFAREKPSWCTLSSKIIWESPHFRLFWKEHLTFYIYSWLRLCRDKWVENDLKMHMCSKSVAMLCCNVLCCMTNFVLWVFYIHMWLGEWAGPRNMGTQSSVVPGARSNHCSISSGPVPVLGVLFFPFSVLTKVVNNIRNIIPTTWELKTAALNYI